MCGLPKGMIALVFLSTRHQCGFIDEVEMKYLVIGFDLAFCSMIFGG
jgi:hypothetical protein